MEIFAPMRTISLACRKRFSKMVSRDERGAFGLRCQGHVLRLHAIAKPGHSSVVTSEATRFEPPRTRSVELSTHSTETPAC